MAEALRSRSQTVGFAESCTGGLLSATFASQAGVSDVYMGSVVAYANRIKEELLWVPSSLIKSVGAVSTPVARHMAEGARQRLGVEWAVSLTGVAGPGGGSLPKPVGTVCLAVRGPGVDEVEVQLFPGDRMAIQEASARRALELLLDKLTC